MAKKKELTVEEKLRALYNLQLIDSRVDEIRNGRGELPLEVRDLEDEVEGFKLRHQKLEDNLNDIDNQIKQEIDDGIIASPQTSVSGNNPDEII